LGFSFSGAGEPARAAEHGSPDFKVSRHPRAAEDGRPSVVLYLSEFDPSGHNMPIVVSRKLQALRDLN
jgi:hypothetical protein